MVHQKVTRMPRRLEPSKSPGGVPADFASFDTLAKEINTETLARKLAAVSCTGEAHTVRVQDTDVSLDIPEGSRGDYQIDVATDFSPYFQTIPVDECVVAPLVDVNLSNVTHESDLFHTISIPHNIPNKGDWHLMRVRTGKAYETEFRLILPKKPDDRNSEGFWVEAKFIKIHTRSFSVFLCSICKTVCNESMKAILYGDARAWKQPSFTTKVEIKVFLSSYLYQLTAFRRVSSLLPFHSPAFFCVVSHVWLFSLQKWNSKPRPVIPIVGPKMECGKVPLWQDLDEIQRKYELEAIKEEDIVIQSDKYLNKDFKADQSRVTMVLKIRNDPNKEWRPELEDDETWEQSEQCFKVGTQTGTELYTRQTQAQLLDGFLVVPKCGVKTHFILSVKLSDNSRKISFALCF